MKPAAPLALLASLAVAATAAADGPPPPAPAPAAGTLPTYFDLGPNYAEPPPAVTDVLTGPAVRPDRPRAWATAEYLLWFVTPMNTPPLILGVPSAFAGAGAAVPPPTAQRIFPAASDIDFGAFSGLRVSGGTTLGADERWALDAGAFFLETKTETANLYSNGQPFAVALGYVAAGSGQPTVLYASRPGLYSGGVSVQADSQVWGADTNLRRGWCNELSDRNDVLFGFKYMNVAESIASQVRTYFPSGTILGVQDLVRTRNDFYGGQVGYHTRMGAVNRGLGLDAGIKFAMGGTRQQVELSGSNSYVAPGLPIDTQAGGLYARGLNYGTFTRNEFTVGTDLTLNLTYNFTRHTQVSLGYSVLWLSSVVRPGEQINPLINDSNIRYVSNPTASTLPVPAFRWNANDFVTQGMNFGLTLAY